MCLALTVVAYASTWRAGFVYEDIRTVIGNGIAQQTEPWHLHELRSLSSLSFRLNHAIDGNNPRGYHALNVALHLVNGVLVYGIAAAISEPLGAVLAAAIFLLSPLQIESVAYVTGRTELLAALMVLLALWLSVQPPKLWHLLGIPACLLLGLLTKETAAVGFLLVPLSYALQYPGILTQLREEGDLPSVLAILALVGGAAAWLLWPLRHLGFGTTGSERGLVPYIAIQAAAFWRYVPMVFVSYGQTIDHDYDLIPHALAYVALFALVGLAVYTVRQWRRGAAAEAFALSMVLIAVLPRLVFRIPEYLNEHQMYLPMVGMSLFLGDWLSDALTVWHFIGDIGTEDR